MTTQEGFNCHAALKRVYPYNGKNPELFLDFKFNVRNSIGGYNKTLLRLSDDVMKCPEPLGEGANQRSRRDRLQQHQRGTLQSLRQHRIRPNYREAIRRCRGT